MFTSCSLLFYPAYVYLSVRTITFQINDLMTFGLDIWQAGSSWRYLGQVRQTDTLTSRTDCFTWTTKDDCSVRWIHYVVSVVILSLPTPTAVMGWSFYRHLCVCLIFRTISQKPLQRRFPNLTEKCSTISPGNPFMLGSKGQMSRSRGTKTVSVWVFAL